MSHRSTEAFQDRSTEIDDELGLWIQRSLEESVQGREPSGDVWHRIRQRVEESPLPSMTDYACRGSPSPLTHLVQAVVVSTLLLTFVFGTNHDLVVPSGGYVAAEKAPVRQASSSGRFEEDVLQGYKLVRMQKEMLARRGGYVQGTRLPR